MCVCVCMHVWGEGGKLGRRGVYVCVCGGGVVGVGGVCVHGCVCVCVCMSVCASEDVLSHVFVCECYVFVCLCVNMRAFMTMPYCC